ncbi:ABC transporter permease [Enterococcus sp. DIV1420a]|uniref:ABC transporter permease n=1 Tax=Enterococcus sp. DIV1420a TaxID=2774672 RepID=UPI0036D5F739
MKLISVLTNIGIKKVLIYKEFLFFSALKNILNLTVQYYLWTQVIKVNSSIGSINDLMLYFTITQSMSILFPRVGMEMSSDMISGDIVHKLVKPISIVKQYFFESLGSTIAKLISIFVINLLLIILFSENVNTVKSIYLVILFVLGYILNFTIEIFFGALSFFTQSLWGIESLKNGLLLILSGGVFPIALYPEWLKPILNYLPFSYSYGKIAEAYMGNVGIIDVLVPQIIFIFVIYIIYRVVSSLGLKRIAINGG